MNQVKHVARMAGLEPGGTDHIGAPGYCPICHNDVMRLDEEGDGVSCAVCGVHGTIAVADGRITVTYTQEALEKSHLRESGRRIHLADLQRNGKANGTHTPQEWADQKRLLCGGDLPPPNRPGRKSAAEQETEGSFHRTASLERPLMRSAPGRGPGAFCAGRPTARVRWTPVLRCRRESLSCWPRLRCSKMRTRRLAQVMPQLLHLVVQHCHPGWKAGKRWSCPLR